MKKVIPNDAILIPDNASMVFKGIIHDTYQWEQKQYDGTIATFEMLKRPDTVVALCLDGDKAVLINEKHPHHPDYSIGLPGGKVNSEDDSTLQAIKREILEETGLEFTNWKLIEVFQPYMYSERFFYVYLADKVQKNHSAQIDGGESIRLVRLSIDELFEQMQKDKIHLNVELGCIKDCTTFEEVRNLPKYIGKEVDR